MYAAGSPLCTFTIARAAAYSAAAQPGLEDGVSAFDVARAWRDRVYRESLTEEQLAALPANPAGDLSDHELSELIGGSCVTCPTMEECGNTLFVTCYLTNGCNPSYDPNCCSSYGWCTTASC